MFPLLHRCCLGSFSVRQSRWTAATSSSSSCRHHRDKRTNSTAVAEAEAVRQRCLLVLRCHNNSVVLFLVVEYQWVGSSSISSRVVGLVMKLTAQTTSEFVLTYSTKLITLTNNFVTLFWSDLGSSSGGAGRPGYFWKPVVNSDNGDKLWWWWRTATRSC